MRLPILSYGLAENRPDIHDRLVQPAGPDPVLVTGGTGFIGSAVVRTLLQSGYRVHALVRPDSDIANLRDLPIDMVKGDLNDPGSLGTALTGCRGLFHVAADYRLWVRNPAPMYETNVEGTRRLMRAALGCGVERIVYTSSVATLGQTGDGTPADEFTPVSLAAMIGHYKRSKFLAEQVVREMIREQGLPAVIVHPSTPVGAGDIKPTPTGRVILDAVQGRIPAFVDTGLNLVDVRDVARGHLLAYERGAFGESYILGGENVSLKEMLERIARIAGRRPPRIRLPIAPLLPLAWLAECWARRPNARAPLLTVNALRMASKKMYFSSARAERELEYRPSSIQDALQASVDWFRQPPACGNSKTTNKTRYSL